LPGTLNVLGPDGSDDAYITVTSAAVQYMYNIYVQGLNSGGAGPSMATGTPVSNPSGHAFGTAVFTTTSRIFVSDIGNATVTPYVNSYACDNEVCSGLITYSYPPPGFSPSPATSYNGKFYE